ncbi:MAG: 50S ribosomal protein L29 [Patescibacteria group bacterium]|nr:50S ribosomal protein L29 [Patescibacteria group bacterium]
MKKKEIIKDIREKKLEQLYKDLASLHKEAREVRFKIANMEAKDINQKNKLRKKIAQMWTIIREKEYEKVMGDVK